MATIIMEIPVDTSLKDKATEVFDKIGLDIPTAFRMFLTRSVYENGLPFGVTHGPAAMAMPDCWRSTLLARRLRETALLR